MRPFVFYPALIPLGNILWQTKSNDVEISVQKIVTHAEAVQLNLELDWLPALLNPSSVCARAVFTVELPPPRVRPFGWQLLKTAFGSSWL